MDSLRQFLIEAELFDAAGFLLFVTLVATTLIAVPLTLLRGEEALDRLARRIERRFRVAELPRLYAFLINSRSIVMLPI